jgi:hypothetical protein
VTAYAEGKESKSLKKGKQGTAQFTHTKATWTSDVSLTNQISSLIKSYQATIPPIPCKLHFNYSVINPKTNFSPTTTTNY